MTMENEANTPLVNQKACYARFATTDYVTGVYGIPADMRRCSACGQLWKRCWTVNPNVSPGNAMIAPGSSACSVAAFPLVRHTLPFPPSQGGYFLKRR